MIQRTNNAKNKKTQPIPAAKSTNDCVNINEYPRIKTRRILTNRNPIQRSLSAWHHVWHRFVQSPQVVRQSNERTTLYHESTKSRTLQHNRITHSDQDTPCLSQHAHSTYARPSPVERENVSCLPHLTFNLYKPPPTLESFG